MTDRLSAKPLYVLALLGMLSAILTLSVLLGELKLGARSKPVVMEPTSYRR